MVSVLYIMKWNIHPDKAEGYPQWAQSAIKRNLSVPGVVEFRAYRGVAGSTQTYVSFEFADMEAWAGWYSSDEVQRVYMELYTMALNVQTELWGPSRIVPEPIKPGAG